MFKKILFLVLLIVLFSTFSPIGVYAEDCDPKKCSSDNTDCLEKVQQSCTQKLSELGTAKNTLTNQLKQLDYQANLTQLKITQTEKDIKTTEQEINNLASNINSLDIELNQLSSVFIDQIVQNYKLSKRVPQFSFFTKTNFNDYLNQYKYIATIQENSQNTLMKMETTRTNYDIQKTAKEQKQKDLEELQVNLAKQKSSLASQQKTKNQLLESTKNDEKKYQQLLAEAQAQLNALRNFSSTAGSSCLSSSPGNGSDGNFYSQRDPRWCRQFIGNSKDTIGEVGCFISSLSMVYKKVGSDISPSAYAANSSNFWLNTAYMITPSAPSGYVYKQVSYSGSTIDNELKAGRYVIAQMRMPGTSVGMHFIVIISGSDGKYKIHDPWYGPDMDFSTNYTTSRIMSLRLITK